MSEHNSAAHSALPSSPSAAVPRYPLRDFFRKPESSDYAISPDGRHLSFLGLHQGRQNIFVQAENAQAKSVLYQLVEPCAILWTYPT